MAQSLSPVVLASAVLVVIAVYYQSLTSPSSPVIKLTYFDAPGRAEVTRVAFRLGNVAFQDERLTREQFLHVKPTLPYGQVPVLTVDGETFAESQAILRFAGRAGGLYGTTTDAGTVCLMEEIMTTVDEINENYITPSRREKDPEKQKHMREAAVAGPLTEKLEKLEARLALVSSLPFFQHTADQVFIHEISVWGMVRGFRSGTLDYIPTTLTDPYDTMNAIFTKVKTAIDTLPPNATPRARYPPMSSSKQLSNPRLTYFDFTGRGEPIRLALHIGGITFEDERLDREAFLERKPTLPYGQVPVLTMNGPANDGLVVAQTFGLLRCVGTAAGLYPENDPVEALKIDEILARVEDVYYAFFPSGKESDQDKKRAMREELVADRIPKVLAMLDTRVADWKRTSPYVLGDEISVVDIAVYNLMQFFTSGQVDFVPATVVEEYTTLLAVNEAVFAHPRVVDWYQQHT